jgi:hypothetical protein
MNLISLDPVGVVQQFWKAAAILCPGSETRFPRQLEVVVPAALPLAIISLPGLV